MKDRLTASAIAGLTGAIVQDIYGLTVKSLKLTDRIFIDFAQVVIMHKPFTGILAFIIGVLAHLSLGILLGVIFGYAVKFTSSNYYWIKGPAYGAVVWLILMALGMALDLPLFKVVPPKPALFTFIGAIIYGLVTAFTLKYLDKKTNLI